MVVVQAEELAIIIRQGLISISQILLSKISKCLFKRRIRRFVSEKIWHRSNVETDIVHMTLLLPTHSCIVQPIPLQEFRDLVRYGNLLTIICNASQSMPSFPVQKGHRYGPKQSIPPAAYRILELNGKTEAAYLRTSSAQSVVFR